jgi:hypothetical protein
MEINEYKNIRKCNSWILFCALNWGEGKNLQKKEKV